MPMSDRRRQLRHLRIVNLAPNALTILAVCAGFWAIRFAIQAKFELATIMIIVAAVLDGLDGRLARLLKSDTDIGAELDSLSDFLSFGVAPGVLLYLWVLERLGGLGWAIALVYVICCALRLARFNVMRREPEQSQLLKRFFVGVPAPLGAMLALLPLFVFLAGFAEVRRFAIAIGIYIAIVALLMISRVATFAFKNVAIGRDQIALILLAVALFATALVSHTWLVAIALDILYLASIPLAMRAKRRLVAADRPRKAGERRASSARRKTPTEGKKSPE